MLYILIISTHLILLVVKDTTNKFKTIENVKNGNKR